MATEIFRKVSLDRLSSPEQIDQLLHVTTARSWIALVALCGCVAAALAWSVTSFLHTTVNGRGVISREEGANSVVALGTGTITDIRVTAGDRIQPGQVIGHIAQPSLAQKVMQTKAELAEAEDARAKTVEGRSEGDRVQLAAMKQQSASDEQDIAHTLEQVQYAKDQIPIDDQLIAKGLITKQTAMQDKQKVASLESNVEQLRVQIAQIGSQQVAMKNEASQLALDYANRINGLHRNLELAEQSLKNASQIVAPGGGRVIDIISYPGALVSSGQPILIYEPDLKPLEVVAYVPADQAKQIEAGMDVHVSPSGFEREEYGYVLGKVRSVGQFPATAEAITRTFENEALMRAMMASGPVTEVHIDFLKNPTAKDGYVWSSPKGPQNPITSGSVSSVEIVTRSQHPIELVIPYLRRKLGLK